MRSAPPAPVTPHSTPTGPTEFASITYTMPKGFASIPRNYIRQEVPLESQLPTAYYVTPGGKPQVQSGIMSILVYSLPAGSRVATAAEQRARIVSYNSKTSFTRATPLTPVTLAGRPAFREYGTEPYPSAGPNVKFRYTAWYLFGTSHVLQVLCQLSILPVNPNADATMKAGCGQLIPSLKVS